MSDLYALVQARVDGDDDDAAKSITVITCRTYHTSDGFASYFITTYDILRQQLLWHLWQHCYENYQPIIISVFLIPSGELT